MCAFQACKAAGNGAHPQDYLNFFSPCKREVKGADEPLPAKQCPPGSAQVPLLLHLKALIPYDELHPCPPAGVPSSVRSGALMN